MRPFERTRFTTNVRSSRERPGITSARNVTFISGRAQTRILRDLANPFDLLKIPIFSIFIVLLLMFRVSVGWMNPNFRTFITYFTGGRCCWFADTVKDRAFILVPTLFRHVGYYIKNQCGFYLLRVLFRLT